MLTCRKAMICRLAFTVVVALVAAKAWAQGPPSGPQAWGAGLVAGLLLLPTLQLVLAALVPAFTRRVRRAIATELAPSIGWGVLVVALTALVAAVLNQGGAPGKLVAGCVLLAALLLAVAGGLGISLALGEWAFRRWQLAPQGPVSVFCGGVIGSWAAAVPIIGWLAGILALFASLGAAVQALLQPHAFSDPPPVPPSPFASPPREPEPQ